MTEPRLTPKPILNQLIENGVTHVVWLPDSETNFMYEQMAGDARIHLVPVCREGESMAIAAGLWVGGKRPVVLIQNTGMFESGDSIRGLALDVSFPLVMMIGYRAGPGTAQRPTPRPGSPSQSSMLGASATTWWRPMPTWSVSPSPSTRPTAASARSPA